MKFGKKDFDKLKVRFRQFGGMKLVKEYTRLGLFGPLAKQAFSCIIHGKSFKSLYPVITKRVNKVLLERYAAVDGNVLIENAKPIHAVSDRPHLWWCWIQGEEKAPVLAKVCLESLRRTFPEYDVVVISKDNMHEWVRFPQHILEKYQQGIIPHVCMTDLLRLELLIRYGGIWIDSTVLCTLPEREDAIDLRGLHAPSVKEMLETELFLFQYATPGNAWNGNVSTWFIASHPGNRLLLDVLAKLYAYWKDYDCLLQYYMIHLFIEDAARRYPTMIMSMPYGWSVPCLELGKHLGDTFNPEQWIRFSNKVYWHKLSYRGVEKYGEGSYYSEMCHTTN